MKPIEYSEIINLILEHDVFEKEGVVPSSPQDLAQALQQYFADGRQEMTPVLGIDIYR